MEASASWLMLLMRSAGNTRTPHYMQGPNPNQMENTVYHSSKKKTTTPQHKTRNNWCFLQHHNRLVRYPNCFNKEIQQEIPQSNCKSNQYWMATDFHGKTFPGMGKTTRTNKNTAGQNQTVISMGWIHCRIIIKPHHFIMGAAKSWCPWKHQARRKPDTTTTTPKH